MGFQMQICLILRFSWSIMVKFYVPLRTSSTKTQMLFAKRNMLWCNFILGLNFISPCFKLIIIIIPQKKGK